jgi:tRNA pseudouridine55 synthase
VNSLHGLLLINKPTGITSHDVVGMARKKLGLRNIGHAGTLDPLASGLMVLLLGEGTKLSDYILNGNKSYRVRVRLGLTTDSLDITGKVLTETPVDLDKSEISSAALKLQGDFTWAVPIFSAVKSEGKKMYEFAHKDQVPNHIPEKEMKFWGVEVIEVGTDFIEVKISCSKGSYIRTWAAQLGDSLKVGGTVEVLQRVESAPYALKSAIEIEQLPEEVKKGFIGLEEALPGWKTLTVRGKDEKLIHNGQISYDLERRLIVEQKAASRDQQNIGVKILSAETGRLLAILEAQPNRGLKIRRVFKIA